MDSLLCLLFPSIQFSFPYLDKFCLAIHQSSPLLTNGIHSIQKGIQHQGTLPNSFHEAAIILMPSPHKDITTKENYKSILFMNIDAKILNKILVYQVQEHIRNIIHHDQVAFIPEMQGWFNMQKSVNVIHHINKLKNKTT